MPAALDATGPVISVPSSWRRLATPLSIVNSLVAAESNAAKSKYSAGLVWPSNGRMTVRSATL